MILFKDQYNLDQRCAEYKKIHAKYPDRIPIICEKHNTSKNIPDIDKNKYLVSSDISLGQFIYVIRKRIKLKPDQAIFIFINNIIPSNTNYLLDLYRNYCDIDGFLYITFSSENTFGNNLINLSYLHPAAALCPPPSHNSANLVTFTPVPVDRKDTNFDLLL